MNNPKETYNKHYLLKIIFILSVLASLIKIEGVVCSSIDYHKYGKETNTELVVNPVQINVSGFYKLFSSLDDSAKIHHPINEPTFLYKSVLFYYDNFQQVHYKVIKNKFISQIDFVSILHKHNISHQSTGKDALLLV